MEIHIDDEYRVISDGTRNFILQKKRVITGENTKGKKPNKDRIGEITYDDVGYCSDLQYAFKLYARQKILKSKVKSIQELNDLLEQIDKRIEEAVKI